MSVGVSKKIVIFFVMSELAQTKAELKQDFRPYWVVNVEYTLRIWTDKA